MPEACWNCKKEDCTKQCSKCHRAYYCDRNCQTNHWAKHREKCKIHKIFRHVTKAIGKHGVFDNALIGAFSFYYNLRQRKIESCMKLGYWITKTSSQSEQIRRHVWVDVGGQEFDPGREINAIMFKTYEVYIALNVLCPQRLCEDKDVPEGTVFADPEDQHQQEMEDDFYRLTQHESDQKWFIDKMFNRFGNILCRKIFPDYDYLPPKTSKITLAEADPTAENNSKSNSGAAIRGDITSITNDADDTKSAETATIADSNDQRPIKGDTEKEHEVNFRTSKSSIKVHSKQATRMLKKAKKRESFAICRPHPLEDQLD
ncbi:uncharacterized protein LOC106166231 [Lingula anatina]|uniref:Uncharacterized protein LOC106166231 n=1 Tax=Lingula anatina TaxID=7574 RepID=A0A1S3IRL6_LINAN|nr:uncharacterized protein LOC106166231 [Lingula anatina]|eukprot:XP_013400174.1 uncharacterized protein LOC106166231 [Lingula anatina]